jgi:hypothetical protein
MATFGLKRTLLSCCVAVRALPYILIGRLYASLLQSAPPAPGDTARSRQHDEALVWSSLAKVKPPP